MADVRKELIIRGRVQGVFFRETCRREAEARKVSGSATNLGDGSVEVFLEGEAEAVEEIVGWCRKGPQWAQVESVSVQDGPVTGVRGFSTD